ncbi:MAG TPA: hypothetical protein VES62_07500 [Thermoleophilaceae bacterium]|nr:hypothetical protein [Thermoleophilaceae bacterium]
MALAARLRAARPLPKDEGDAHPHRAPVAPLLLVLALGGLGLAVVGRTPTAPERPLPALIETEAARLPRGGLPLIGDPIRDLTIWYAQRVSDANRAAVENLKGNFLTPVDPLTDQATTDLYGKILIVTIPLLTLGGLILGYLIMVARTTGESTYAVRSVTPRFVVGAVLSILGIYLVSILAQFVTATDLAMVGVSVSPGQVGGAEEWPAGGGVFLVLQRGGFDPRIGEGPANWNAGAWLSSGLLAAVLMTFLQMINAVLGAVERLLVLLGPICLAAYALPATQRLANLWLKLLSAVLAVRFGWAIVFILFSLQVPPHLNDASVPLSVGDTNALIGLALGAAALMLVLPPILVNLVLNSPGPLRVEQ